MIKRKLTADQIRDLVQARMTKGLAFMLTDMDYQAEQAKVRARLATMTIDEIREQFPYYLYDVR